MKKALSILTMLLVIFLSGQAFAADCAGRSGECYGPPKPNTGWIGTENFPWGHGYFASGDFTRVTIDTDGLTAPTTRSMNIPLTGFMIQPIGTGYTILVGNDGANTPQTSPGITSTDGIPKLVWASGEEGASIMYSFIVPYDYSGSLTFRLAASTNTDTGATSWGFDWGLFVNNSATAFDAASYAQTSVACAEGSPSTKNAFFTLTADATAAADIAAGDVVTVVIFPWDVRVGPGAGGTTELIAVQARYTSVN